MSDHFWILSMKGLRPKHFRNFEICGEEIKWYFHVKITDNISSFYQFGIYWVLFSLFSEICDFFLNSGFELQFNLKKFVTNVLFFRSISKWFEKKPRPSLLSKKRIIRIICHWSLFIPPENIGKLGVFRGYRKKPVAYNGLKIGIPWRKLTFDINNFMKI